MSKLRKVILGIETSCDDTAAAVCINGQIFSNIVADQDVHRQYGGVVPELASRAHLQHIVPVVDQALKTAKVTMDDIDAVAYTQGPGLLGSLLVGSTFARGITLSLSRPLIGVNHLQAHVSAHYIDEPIPPFPFLCLLVSGGHTQIIRVDSHSEMEILGTTLDDAAGEAFDKAAKILGLDYPGGPIIDQHAKAGNALAYKFPDSRVGALDFSFSGLKTAFLYFIKDGRKKDPGFVESNLEDICASLEHTIVSYLLRKLEQAVEETGIKHVGIAGGVSANSLLRSRFTALGKQKGWRTYIPAFEYCTDNAAMIATSGYYQYLSEDFQSLDSVPFARYDN